MSESIEESSLGSGDSIKKQVTFGGVDEAEHSDKEHSETVAQGQWVRHYNVGKGSRTLFLPSSLSDAKLLLK